jgi:hypothetical protein
MAPEAGDGARAERRQGSCREADARAAG